MPIASRTALILVAALALGPVSTGAQSPSLPIPVRVETLVSAKVGELREFWVSLPDRYNASTERYPVLYMMDGDFNFNSGVIGGVRQAAWMGEIPEFIIVGIKNTNRSGLTCRLRVIENGEHVPPDALVEGLCVLFQGWKITRPLTESSFAEIRAQVDGRLEKFGVPGRIDDDALKGLGDRLLGEKKLAKAIEVLEYRASSYPQSADAQVGLGEAYRQSGNLDKARECYKRALALAPDHAAATAKLKEAATGPILAEPPVSAGNVPTTKADAGGKAARPVIGTVKSPPKGAYFGQTLPGETPVRFAPEILTAISPWVEATAFSPDGTQFFVWDFTYSNEPVFSADGQTLMFTGKKSTGTLYFASGRSGMNQV
jgi:tetratricopeptide (TPR) repeat protein